MYLSLGLNIVLIISLIALLIRYLKLRREDREFEDQIQRSLSTTVPVNRFTGQVGAFSLGSLEDLLGGLGEQNERQPLLQSGSQHATGGRSGPQNVRGARLQETLSTSSTVSDDTFLRHRPDYKCMKTFKPEAEKSKQTSNENRV